MWNIILIPLFIIAVAFIPSFIVFYHRDPFFRQHFVLKHKRKTVIATVVKKSSEEVKDQVATHNAYKTHLKQKSKNYVLTFKLDDRKLEFLTRRALYDSCHEGDYGEIIYYKSYLYGFTKMEKPSSKEEDVFEQYYAK